MINYQMPIRSCLLALAAIALILYGSSTRAAGPENTGSPAGVNLLYYSFYTSDMLTLDLMTKSRPWQRSVASRGAAGAGWWISAWDACDGANPELCVNEVTHDVNADGWVTAVARSHEDPNSPGSYLRTVAPGTLVLRDIEGLWPVGKYVLLWDAINVPADAQILIRFQRNSSDPYLATIAAPASAGRAIIDPNIAHSHGIEINIAGIGQDATGNPGGTAAISNMRLLPPGGVQGTVASSGEILSVDAFSACNPGPRTATPQVLTSSTTCIDFEHAAWNRFTETLWDSTDQRAVRSDRVVFHPDALSTLRKFSTIRTMNWNLTNDSDQETWNDRGQLSFYTWGAYSGVPYEVMLALSNTLDADPWFTIPERADNNYVANLASLVKSHLARNSTALVEWSNETWNGAFTVASWAANLPPCTSTVTSNCDGRLPRQRNPGGPVGDSERHRYTAQRTMEIASIWRSIHGAIGSSEEDQLKIVVAGQAANLGVMSQRLDAYNSSQNSPSQRIDFAAIAPYFGAHIGHLNNVSTLQDWTLESLFEELDGGKTSATPGMPIANGAPGGALAQAAGWVNEHQALLEGSDVQLIAYEGGQHLSGVYLQLWNPPADQQHVYDLLRNANNDPRMYAIYERYLAQWDDENGQLMTHYGHVGNDTLYGNWGARKSDFLANGSLTSGAKHDALVNYIDEHMSQTGVDTDGDGFEDADDAYPNDPTEWADGNGNGIPDNAESTLNFDTNSTDTGEYGVKFGVTESPIVRRFWLDDATTLQITLRGYDITNQSEVSVRLNGSNLGFLTKGPRRQLNSGDTYSATGSSGINELVFTSDSGRWGITDLRVDTSGGSGPSPTPPAAPSSLSLSATFSDITASWNANAESDVTGYEISRSASPGGSWSVIGSTTGVTSTSFTDSNVAEGDSWSYYVTALDSENLVSNPSAVKTITVPTSPPAGNIEHSVSNIDVTIRRNGQRYSGQAIVTVTDANGAVVPAALVTARWTLTENGSTTDLGSVSTSTTTTGEATLNSSKHRVGSGAVFTVTITDVTSSNSTYIANQTSGSASVN